MGTPTNIGYRWKYQLYCANKETEIYKEKLSPNKMMRNSKLSSFNKIIVHDTFAVPVFVPSVGIVDWTINKIREIDSKTRKQLTMTKNFHPNGEVDHIPLYTKVRSNLALPSWLIIMKIFLLPKIYKMNLHYDESTDQLLVCILSIKSIKVVQIRSFMITAIVIR